MTTIRARLLLWLLSAVVAAGLSSAFTLYENARNGLDQVFDEQLQQTALSLRDQSFEFALPPQLPATETRNSVVVQVWNITGVRVYFSELYRELPGLQRPGLSDVQVNKVAWRVYSLPSRGYVIQVAQPLAVRQQRAVALALKTLAPLSLMLPVLGAAIWLIVGAQLRPLDRLADSVRMRQPEALEPLGESALPDEIRPLVVALNDLLARLRAARTSASPPASPPPCAATRMRCACSCAISWTMRCATRRRAAVSTSASATRPARRSCGSRIPGRASRWRTASGSSTAFSASRAAAGRAPGWAWPSSRASSKTTMQT